jgi:hypothetical protein
MKIGAAGVEAKASGAVNRSVSAQLSVFLELPESHYHSCTSDIASAQEPSILPPNRGRVMECRSALANGGTALHQQ